MNRKTQDNGLAILLIAAVALAGWLLIGGCQSDDHYHPQPTPANPYRLPRYQQPERGDFHVKDRFAGSPALKAW